MAPTNIAANTPSGVVGNGQASTAVQVKNIPDHVETRDILAIFRSLIGGIQCFEESKEHGRTTLAVTFFQHELAMKALCLNGYAIGGANLDVSYLHAPPSRIKRSSDDRRNLYVLGLPFALTKGEFCALFSRFGTVVHCVILATVDNSSRRRGFVVMSSHEEARRALTNLTRAQIKGHTIDVSWAVVQRSQGFLDGGDRALLLDPRSSHLPGSSYHQDRRGYSSSGSDSSEYSPIATISDPRSIVNSPLPTRALLITNLPALLFSEAHDLNPLLGPFGKIERMQTVQNHDSNTVSAIVLYATVESATEARNSLNGQIYDFLRQVEVHFVHPSFGNYSGDLRLPDGLTSKSYFEDIPSYSSSRPPSPFFGSNVPNSADPSSSRTGGYSQYSVSQPTSLPFTHSFKDRYEGRSNSSIRSRAASPRNLFLGNQANSRRVQGGLHSTLQGFST